MFSFLRRKKKTTPEQMAESQEVSQTEAMEFDSIPPETTIIPPTKQTKQVTEVQPAQQPVKTETETLSEKFSPPPTSKETVVEAITQPKMAQPKQEQEEKIPKTSFFTRLKQGLSKTRQNFTDSLTGLVLGKKEIDDELLDELEMILLTADVGVDATDKIIQNLTEQVSRKVLKEPEALISSLKAQLEAILTPVTQPLKVNEHLANNTGPFVILMVGINGVGKTTTIGKLAKKYQLEGKSVMLAAGDTFRAAAVEQLQTWGERNNVPVIAQKTGADSAAVLFDAIQSAKAKKIDVLIADTAGRLHTQSNLMEELKKVTRVMAKVDDSAPHEVMLVIDAGTGQNALNQTKQFKEAVNVSGITLTKLDGTAKGGIVFALAEQNNIPIRFIGVGESIDDLRPFDSKAFTKALFDQSTHT